MSLTYLIFLVLLDPTILVFGINIRMVRDIQKHFSSNWIILQSCSKNQLDINPMVMELKTAGDVYFTVYNWSDFTSFNRKSDYTRPIVILSCLFCEEDCFFQFNKLNANNFISNFIWITESSEAEMSRVYIPVNCLTLTVEKIKAHGGYNLTEIYRTSAASQFYKNWFASWSPEDGLDVTKTAINERRANWFGQRLLVYDPPFVNEMGVTHKYPRHFEEIFESIIDRLNGTVEATDNIRANYEFSLPPWSISTVNADRCMKTIFSCQWQFFFIDVADEFLLDSYLKPFTPDVWLTTAAWTILVALLMYCMGRRYSSVDVGFLRHLFRSFFVILQTSSDNHLQDSSAASQLVNIMHWILSLFLFSCYSAILISYVTIVIPKPPFTTLQGVLDDGRYNVVIPLKGRAVPFKESSNPEMIRIIRNHIDPPSQDVLTYADAFLKMCHGQRKLLLPGCRIGLYRLQIDFPFCTPSEYSVPIQYVHSSWASRKHTPYKRAVNFGLAKVAEAGMLMNYYYKKTIRRMMPVFEDVKPITIKSVAVLFIVFWSGALISVLFLLLEKWKSSRFKLPQ